MKDKIAKKKPSKKLKVNNIVDNNEVDVYMKALKHPRKSEISALRAIIKKSSNKISERIKWNAPSYHYNGVDMAAFNPWSKTSAQLIMLFPRGMVKDPDKLLLGEWKGRRMMEFSSMKEVKEKQLALTKIIKAWVRTIEE